MRPVNLIPPEARRGEKAPMRTGALSYVIVAVLAVALLGVTGAVLTNNQVSDRKAEKSGLESELAEAQAQARRVSSYADFASLQQAREQTVATLAQSRFDWERVLRELAIVIPEDVWLTQLTATVSPAVQLSDSDSSSSSSSSVSGLDSVQGPSLQMEGCGDGHEAVARFLAALRDIDGVTRVSVLNSDRPDPSSATEGSSTGTSDSGGVSGDCATRDFISKFGIVAAFDAVQISANTQATLPATSQPTASGSTASAADQSQVSDAQQQLEQHKQATAQRTQKARKDVSTFIPGTATAP
jgi:Tfp pilus assembly protein PilN